MGRSRSDTGDEKNEKSSTKDATNNSDSDSDSDLSEEEFIVEKIMQMRTTKKGKVQCKPSIFLFRSNLIISVLFSCKLKIY